MKGGIVLAVYLGIGALLHGVFVGPTFDWSSVWTFGWLLAWPVGLLIAAGGIVISLVVTGIVIWVGYSWIQMIAEWRAKRRAEWSKGR